MGRKRKMKRGKENEKSSKRRRMEEPQSESGEVPQNIVQEEPAQEREEPCVTSAGLPVKETEKKGTKRGKTSSKNEDEPPNKRGRMVEGESRKDVTSKPVASKRPREETDERKVNEVNKKRPRKSSSAGEGSSPTTKPEVEPQPSISKHLSAQRGKKRSGEQHSDKEDLKRQKTSDTEATSRRRLEGCDSSSQETPGVSGTQTAAPSDIATDSLALENFTFHQKLGEGSYGKVMLATHTVSGHRLAVKMVRKRELLEARDAIRIEREILEITGGSTFFTHAYGTFQTAVRGSSASIHDPSTYLPATMLQNGT
ncbi:uncharacterized protein LOC142660195 [Rhinoderma darwinii]|uniref:uncharacterized protein LOC142660194 n=1 Tax=Rhinoderma darwinii TaxID=43563 RepID=UPI003F67179B